MRTSRKMRAATRKNPHEGYLIDFLIAFWAGVLVIGLSGDLARCQNEDERVLIQTCQPGLEILADAGSAWPSSIKPATMSSHALAGCWVWPPQAMFRASTAPRPLSTPQLAFGVLALDSDCLFPRDDSAVQRFTASRLRDNSFCLPSYAAGA
jgi:hypothetical protein